MNTEQLTKLASFAGKSANDFWMATGKRPTDVIAELAQALLETNGKVQALAAENAALNSGFSFFMYSDETGFETHKTREEAIKSAQEMIGICREDADDGWPEEVDSIRWGVIVQRAAETDFHKPNEENGFLGSSDYKLVPEFPATSAAVAQIELNGVRKFSEETRAHATNAGMRAAAFYADLFVDMREAK